MTIESPHDDALLSRVLISTWVLHTGRTLRRDVPPSDLSVEELINFWADPLLDEPPPADPPGNDTPSTGTPGNNRPSTGTPGSDTPSAGAGGNDDTPSAGAPTNDTTLKPAPLLLGRAGPGSATPAAAGGLSPPVPI
jgi:hypothetical protein